MQTIVDINPLKLGKIEAYKTFVAEVTGPRQKEYTNLLNRYGIKTVHAYFHKIGEVDFVVVVHTAEDDARKRLEHFATSLHPMDKWFREELSKLHDFSLLNGRTQAAEAIFAYNVNI